MTTEAQRRSNRASLQLSREMARERGDCIVCRCRPAKAECSLCEDCIKRATDYKAKRKARGLCGCGRMPTRGTKVCVVCAEKDAKRNARIKADRKAAGLCVQCGGQKRPGQRSCDGCLSLNAARRRGVSPSATSRYRCRACGEPGHNRVTCAAPPESTNLGRHISDLKRAWAID